MKYGIRQYIFVIRELTAREIKRKYARSVLGIVWSVLNPLLFMIVIGIVFSGYSLYPEKYPVYFITGRTLWILFSTATMTSLTAFEDNKSLFIKAKVKRETFILSRNYTALVNLWFSCIALLIVYICVGVKINWTIIIIIIDVFLELLFSIGISFILATSYVFYKDIKNIWNHLIFIIAHMVAVFVPIERYPKNLHQITQMNPLYIYPNIARQCVLYGTFNKKELFIAIIWAVVTFILGIIYFKIRENEIVKKI
ncbi:MAG: ABC transporter permease [Pseudobutyrivibrio sp.]|nr:ABC transporter permease [Pseudobutyrivibrio sp.]